MISTDVSIEKKKTYHPRFFCKVVDRCKGVDTWYIAKLQTKQNVAIVFPRSDSTNTLPNKDEVRAK